jgi:formylglycine-generating enzyme required for sulfatase activity
MAGSLRKKGVWLLLALTPLGIAYGLRGSTESKNVSAANAAQNPALSHAVGMIRLPGGEFLMGTPRPSPDDQRPVHRVVLAPFWMDATHVTNEQFAEFVAESSYRTTAEERGWSLVFNRDTGAWNETPGACWRHPTGAESSLAGKENYPVVHVSWFDAVAYSSWAKKRLPTEAEYEFAARGGLNDAAFAWGRELNSERQMRANYWQGKHPLINLAQDGFLEVSPTKTFPANPYGLYDIAGNVTAWCSDWYAHDAYGKSTSSNSAGPKSGTERVLRGGSWHSTAEKGAGLHVGDRDSAVPEVTSSRIGFRCVKDIERGG